MKNYEKYAEEIKNYTGKNLCKDFIRPIILKTKRDVSSCRNIDCGHCAMLQNIWLMEDYEEPEVDWGKVPVDTPILVKGNGNEEWSKRYFAKYEGGKVYAWCNGRTSWNEASKCAWDYARLPEDEEINNEKF